MSVSAFQPPNVTTEPGKAFSAQKNGTGSVWIKLEGGIRENFPLSVGKMERREELSVLIAGV